MINQKTCLISTADGKVTHCIIESATKNVLTTLSEGSSVSKIDVIPSGRLALLGTEEGQLQFWDLEGSKLLREYKSLNFKLF